MVYNVARTIRQGSAARARAGPGARRGGPRGGRALAVAYEWHRPLEGQSLRFTLADLRRGDRRRPGAAGAALLPAGHDRAAAGRAALQRPRARGPRPLHPRGLQQLPQPEGAAARGRDGPLRPPTPGGRGRLRPALPVGLAAHGARSRARRRQVPGLVALAPPREPPRARAALEHADLRVPARTRPSTPRSPRGSSRCCASVGHPYSDAEIERRRARRARARRSAIAAACARDGIALGDVAGAQRGDRADRLPAEPRTRAEGSAGGRRRGSRR